MSELKAVEFSRTTDEVEYRIAKSIAKVKRAVSARHRQSGDRFEK